MHTHGTKFSRQRWWRGAGRPLRWGFAFDGQPTVLPSMPLVCDKRLSLLIMRWNSNFWTECCTLMEESLSVRGDWEKVVDTKVGGLHSMVRTVDCSPPKYAYYVIYMDLTPLIMLWNSKFWTDRCTLMEESLADRGDREELVDTKVGGLHSTDSRVKPSHVWYGP